MWIKNEKGQMAVFVALFFQVLFVFFAMIINMGLVIHDKINLQNAVDIAAYYGAAKQAEVLNQIAHINYQMRQNYKLLVWRYRVLGTLSNKDHLYKNENKAESLVGGDEKEYLAEKQPNIVSNPAICTATDYWYEYKKFSPEAEGWCRDFEVKLPTIPLVSGGPGFVPGAEKLKRIGEIFQEQFKATCLEVSFKNWIWAARILAHFRVDGVIRKRKIIKLAENLSSDEFEDLRGQPVEKGVENTVKYNLTDGHKNVQVEYFNSMKGITRSDWLPGIKINPIIGYIKLEDKGECRSSSPLAINRGNFPSPSKIGSVDDSNMKLLRMHWTRELYSDNNDDEYHSSVGFEKNPWYQVYTGVSAITEVRKPFSPGGAIRLQARGFAKPFGGRIGPWYGKTWPHRADCSQASSRDQMVDKLLPSRKKEKGCSSVMDSDGDWANYSRYPGDSLGLKSQKALAAMHRKARELLKKKSGAAPMTWASYDHLGWLASLQQTGDSLARPAEAFDGRNVNAPQRKLELAAIAPDVFDALYYSIEPRYYDNYFGENTKFGEHFLEEERIYDFGSYKDTPKLKPNTEPSYSVLDQVEDTSGMYHGSVRYIIRNWDHLLTSWHQKAAVNYEIDPELFGNCKDGDDGGKKKQYPTTGNCVAGGRTGYSVKNVSMDFLCSSNHQLSGGETSSGDGIENPPSGPGLLNCGSPRN